MQVRVNIEQSGMKINEDFTGATAEEVVGKMKARVARELPFAMRFAVSAMNNLMFAQEVVKRYNENQKKRLPTPTSCQHFLELAQGEGFASIVGN